MYFVFTNQYCLRIIIPFIFSWFLIPFAKAQVVNIPDANFKNALLNHVPVIDLNGDGQIQVSVALAFTGAMKVNSRSITDMTGVEAFTNMTSLDCGGNLFTSLTLSNLPSLAKLSERGNASLTSLTLNNLTVLILRQFHGLKRF